VQETTNNAVSRDIFQRLGWSLSDGRWRGIPSTAMPTHVTVVDEVAAAIQPTMASSSQ
jgi:hypothetical protein